TASGSPLASLLVANLTCRGRLQHRNAADAGGAEDAAHAATDLRRNADGAAVGLLEQDALDETAVVSGRLAVVGCTISDSIRGGDVKGRGCRAGKDRLFMPDHARE